jgi:hypothetical protein
MSRESVDSAIHRHAARGMYRAQLVMTYGRDAVLRVLGSEEPPPKVAEPVARAPFHDRLVAARMAKKHGRPKACVIIGINEMTMVDYEAALKIPKRPEIIAAIAAYMDEPVASLTAEIAVLRAANDKRVAEKRLRRFTKVSG